MEEKLICITTVKSRIEAEQMLSFLKENGIYAAIQGGVQELYTGDSVSGDKIMVSAAHKEKAKSFWKISLLLKPGLLIPEGRQQKPKKP